MILELDGFASGGFELERDHGPCSEARRHAVQGRAQADEVYFLSRMHGSVARAGASADSIVRLVHYELAGRYSVAAVAARRNRCRQ